MKCLFLVNMVVIKHKAEDFVVKEILDIDSLKNETGEYSLFILRKRYTDTISAISKISSHFKIDRKKIGYCGIKDKKAVTEQYISVPSFLKDKVLSSQISDEISLEYLFNVSETLNIGKNKGNYFEIVVRNLDSFFNDEIIKNVDYNKIPNYFGDQRFSTKNVDVGRSILKKDFLKAVDIVKEDKAYSGEIEQSLERNPNDLVGALKNIPKDILIFYIHSYQSHLWNLAVKKLIYQDRDVHQKNIPILGFSSELDGDVESIYGEIMSQEGITLRDFIIREVSFLSMEGSTRDLFMNISDFSYEIKEDEEFKNKKKCLLKFELGKGSYATELVKYLFET